MSTIDDTDVVLDGPTRRWLAQARLLNGVDGGTARGTAGGTDEREAARVVSDRLHELFGSAPPPGIRRITHTLDGPAGALRVDEYRAQSAHGRLPGYLLMHGGAFRLGHLDERINVEICSARAADSGYAVFCVDYRLAPQHPYPAALHDASAVLAWLHCEAAALNVEAGPVVGGVSAGGNLAAAVALHARDSGGPPVRGLLLEVPAADLRAPGSWLEEYGELNGFADPSSLSTAYLAGADPADPLLSPLLADLRGLPPTHVMTCEYDPLRDGGELLVQRMRAAGVEVSASRHLGQLHGAPGLTGVSRSARLWHAEVVAALRELAR